jgi:hypothetical protein
MTTRRWASRLGAALLLTTLVGCGSSSIYPVRGQIQFKDGAPAKELAGGTIEFQAEGAPVSARGTIDEEGRFEMSTEKRGDGAHVGKNKVVILEASAGSPEAPPKKIVDPRYHNPRTSDLEVTVEPKTNEITLTVERAPKR